MTKENNFCIATFNFKDKKGNLISLIDNDAQIFKMTHDKLIIKSYHHSINADLIDSISLTLNRYSNTMVFINTTILKTTFLKKSCKYYLKIPSKVLFLPNKKENIELRNPSYQKFINLATSKRGGGKAKKHKGDDNNE